MADRALCDTFIHQRSVTFVCFSVTLGVTFWLFVCFFWKKLGFYDFRNDKKWGKLGNFVTAMKQVSVHEVGFIHKH